MQKFSGIGTLVKDPELKTVKVGDTDISVCELRVAFDTFLGKNKHTEFFTCTAWREKGEVIAKNFTKGRNIYVEGIFKSREYIKTTEKGDEVKMKDFQIDINSFEFCDKAPATAGTTTAPESAAVTSKNDPF